MTGARLRFEGWIAGLGTSSGVRLVLGHWARSPFGPFSDVMIERADGKRLLLVPAGAIRDLVTSLYIFDEVRTGPVRVDVLRQHWAVTAPGLDLRFTTGPRGPLGRALRAVPGALAVRPAWSALIDPAARLLSGARTRGESRTGCREWYGARDLRPITTAAAVFEGRDLGPLAPVRPPVRFGFASVPRHPAAVRVTTTVAIAPHAPTDPTIPPLRWSHPSHP
ncbi:hypothetical protein ABZ547_00755 [Streptomyces sparsogenes]|uniref:hypothetical protein n=1 Tax=Streptomyces sparsogenes TaxID=67365 RepID=UPI0033D7237D